MSEPVNHEEREKMQEAIRLREERRDRGREEGERSLWQNLSMIGALGWLIVTPTLLGALLGTWLDARYGMGVYFTGSLIFLGACLGFWMAWKRMNEK